MKKLSTTLILAATSTALATTPALAVPWSSNASSCVPEASAVTSGLVSSNAASGAVTFAAGKSGHIKLSCPIHMVSSASYSPVLSAVTYYNDNGYVGGVNHCTIQVDVLRSNLDSIEHGADISSYSTAGTSSTGRAVKSASLTEALDFDTSYYWVDIDLYRDSNTATCNPAVVGTYLGSFAS